MPHRSLICTTAMLVSGLTLFSGFCLGALRTAFLVRAGLSKQAFIGTVILAAIAEKRPLGAPTIACPGSGGRKQTELACRSELARTAGVPG